MNDITKLPRWAQELVAQLNRERDNAIRTLKNFENNQTKSDLFVDKFDPKTPSRMFIQSDRVVFEMKGNNIEIAKVGTMLQVRVTGLAESLRVQPNCANTISIWAEKHRHD